MCILIVCFNYEINMFLLVLMLLVLFYLYYGDDVYCVVKGMCMVVGVFIDLVEVVGVEIVVFVVVGVNFSGCVVVDVYIMLCDVIVVVVFGCDVLLFDLYGVMVVENSDDGEGDLFECLCVVVFDVLIVVVLDLYGNFMQKFIDLVDIVVSFKMYLYVDMYEIGEYVGCLLFDKLVGCVNFVLVWCCLLLVMYMLCSCIDEGVMYCVVVLVRQVEQDGMLVVLILVGFGLVDIVVLCFFIVVVGNGDKYVVDVVV